MNTTSEMPINLNGRKKLRLFGILAKTVPSVIMQNKNLLGK